MNRPSRHFRWVVELNGTTTESQPTSLDEAQGMADYFKRFWPGSIAWVRAHF